MADLSSIRAAAVAQSQYLVAASRGRDQLFSWLRRSRVHAVLAGAGTGLQVRWV